MADGSLVVESLVAGYGQGVVIEDCSFTVASGEAVSLVGRNGAGKTTLLRTIMGLLSPRSGAIRFAGQPIGRLAPFEIARRGLAYVPQGREIFVDLTVEENLLLGDLKAPDARMAFGLFPALEAKRREAAGRLSGGQQQQLAIGRALMGRPKLLLLDEPSEGIQPSIVTEIAAILAGIVTQTGMGLILVEQNMEMALAVTSRVLFLEQGHVTGSESSDVLRADPSAIEARLSI